MTRFGRALLVVDVQNDFIDGSLAVPKAAQILSPLNRLLHNHAKHFDLVVFTQDWHPSNHTSFVGNNPGQQVFQSRPDGQMMWPAHCVQGTTGAELHADLTRPANSVVVQKGTDPNVDSYSGFFDNEHAVQTELHDVLQRHHIHTVVVLGLATDYCVRYTAQDALKLGYKVIFLSDCSRGIASQEIEVTGVETLTSGDFLEN